MAEVNITIAARGTQGATGATGATGPAGYATPIANNTVLANVSGSTAAPTATSAADMRSLMQAVSYASQSLTAPQQAQARGNIGIDDALDDWVVTWDSIENGTLPLDRLPGVAIRKDQSNTVGQPLVISTGSNFGTGPIMRIVATDEQYPSKFEFHASGGFRVHDYVAIWAKPGLAGDSNDTDANQTMFAVCSDLGPGPSNALVKWYANGHDFIWCSDWNSAGHVADGFVERRWILDSTGRHFFGPKTNGTPTIRRNGPELYLEKTTAILGQYELGKFVCDELVADTSVTTQRLSIRNTANAEVGYMELGAAYLTGVNIPGTGQWFNFPANGINYFTTSIFRDGGANEKVRIDSETGVIDTTSVRVGKGVAGGGSLAVPSFSEAKFYTGNLAYLAASVRGVTYADNFARGDLIFSTNQSIGGTALSDDVIIRGDTGDVEFVRGAFGFANARLENPSSASTALKTYETSLSVWQEPWRGQASASGATIGFLGATPIVRQTLPAAATDAATTQTLANALRDLAINFGLAN